MLLDPPHARLELADDHAVADDGGVVVDHRAAESNNLFAKLLTGRHEIGRDVGAKGPQVRLRRHIRANLANIRPGIADVRPDIAEFGAHLAQKLEDEARGLFRHPAILTSSPTCVSLPS